MDDTISRQAALDWLKNEWDGMVTSVFDGIEQLPSAEPKIGRWIKIGEITDSKGIKKHVLNCSECGALHRVRKLYTGEYVNAEYCPHCGADMRGEDGEA